MFLISVWQLNNLYIISTSAYQLHPVLNLLQPTAKHFTSHLNTTWTWQLQCVSKHKSFNTQRQSHTLWPNFWLWLFRQFFFSFVLCYQGSGVGDIQFQEPWLGAQKWFEDGRKKGIFNWNNVIFCPSGAGNKTVTPSSHSLVFLPVKVLSHWEFINFLFVLVLIPYLWVSNVRDYGFCVYHDWC